MKTCSKCGEAKALDAFYPRYATCKPCVREKQKAYEEANRERVNEIKRKANAKWKAANPDKVRRMRSDYRTANYEREIERERRSARKRYAEKRDEVLAAVAKWRKANPEKIKTIKAAYHETNKTKIAERQKAYQATRKTERAEYLKRYLAGPGGAVAAAYRRDHRDELIAKYEAQRDTLSPNYVATSLGIPVAELTPEMLDATRTKIYLGRLLGKPGHRKVSDDE